MSNKFEFFVERTLQPRCPPDKLSGKLLRLCVELNRFAEDFFNRVTDRQILNAVRLLRNAVRDWLADHSWRAYQQWVESTKPTPNALNAQREKSASWIDAPVFTILSKGCSDGDAWTTTLRSLQRQTYPHWVVRRLPRPATSESEQLNEALRFAAGDYVTFVTAGDVLAPNALFEVAERIAQQPNVDVIYTDEDQLRGSRRVKPQFKPDWSPELLLAENYLGSLTVMRTELVTRLGGFRSSVDGVHHWDLALRISEHSDRVTHIGNVLIHRPEARPSPVPSEVKRKILSEHLERRGESVAVVDSPDCGLRLHWTARQKPLVSIVIPNRNQARLLKTCVSGLLERTDYKPIEIIVVDNGSTDPGVLAYYDQLQRRSLATVVPYDETFNYSRACNLGAKSARGEMLLFLNNDIEVIHSEWLDEMTAWAMQPQTGVVGAKLLYPNRRIQHAGMILNGPDRSAAHVFRHLKENSDTIFGSTEVYRNFLAVTGACQLLRRDVFETVGGYDEAYQLCCSDMAICLETVRRGLRIVYTPHARLIHHESASRGKTNPHEESDLQRLSQLLDAMNITSDPYFHPSLALVNSPPDFALRADAA